MSDKEHKIKMNIKKFVIKRKDLKKHTKLQLKYLDEREKELKTELKAIEPAKKKV